ncbi:MAG: DNA-processing protein DprA [Parcubacteria group bacterium]|jgi:DNA processing protein
MKFLNALNKINGLGPQKMKMLLDFFGSPENVWKSDFQNLVQSGIGESLANKIVSEREKINPEEEMEKLAKENVRIIALNDSAYPPLLREIPSAPYILYIKSTLELSEIFSGYLISIVGSRKMTSYGKQVAYSFARDLATSGITIVSGMALGIDAEAHTGALEVKGKTIAILGSSLEDSNIGPRANYNLSRRIIESGALVSDFPLGTPSVPGNFPARNRLMAGLTLGTLIVEAQMESGSLITANLAVEFNREVFSVPGPIFSESSQGTNKLIREGAKLVTSVQDILEELNLEKRTEIEKAREIIPDSPEEEIILKNLGCEAVHIDKLIKLTKLNTSTALSALAMMEMKGMIKDIGGQNYIVLR